jgi:hypothetical protein
LSKGYRQTELARLLNVPVRYFAVGKSSTKDSMHRASVYGNIEAEKSNERKSLNSYETQTSWSVNFLGVCRAWRDSLRLYLLLFGQPRRQAAILKPR